MVLGGKMYSEFKALASYIQFISADDNTQNKPQIDKECFEFFHAQLSTTVQRPATCYQNIRVQTNQHQAHQAHQTQVGVFEQYSNFHFSTLQALYSYHYQRWGYPLCVMNLIVRGYLILAWNYMKTLLVFGSTQMNCLANLEKLFADIYDYFTDASLFNKCGSYNTFNHYALLIDTTFSTKPPKDWAQ